MPVIKVFEYSSLKVNSKFTERQFEQLVYYNEIHGNKYFNVGNRKIYFKNYVGVIQIGNLIIEILPKADKTESEEIKAKWHNALIYMLHIAGYISIDSLTRAELNFQKITIIDLFYKVFLDEVKTITHKGLIRQYRHKDDNRPYLKGRILFNKHISENYLNKEMFFTSAQVYDQNNIFNRILFQALLVLQSNGKASPFFNEINRLLLYFDDIETINVTDSHFEKLHYSRNKIKYKDAINLARMILQNYSPDLQTGENNIIGLLFDMNHLFEKTVYRLLKKQEKNYKSLKLKLSSQVSKKFWNKRTIRPDIIGEYQLSEEAGIQKIIIDMKWKKPSGGKPSDDDLKQMYSYNIHFGSLQSVLLYPKCEENNNISHCYQESKGIKNEYRNHNCSTYYIDLFDEKGLIKKDAGMGLLNHYLKINCKEVV